MATQSNRARKITVPPQPPKDPEEDVSGTKILSEMDKFDEKAKRLGYQKIPEKESDAIIQWKSAWLTCLILVIGDLIFFISNSVVENIWVVRAVYVQILGISILKDLSAVVLGKMRKYYDLRHDI